VRTPALCWVCTWLAASLVCQERAEASGPSESRTPGPRIAGVQAERRPGTGWIDIRYELRGAPGASATVIVAASQDGGASYDVPVLSVSGDVGEGIAAGAARHILWDAAGDAPGLFEHDWRVALQALPAGTLPPLGEMVRIPAGPFLMGAAQGDPQEAPPHRVSLASYAIDRTEVTNRAFMWFVQCTGYRTTAEQEGGSVLYRDGGYQTVAEASWRAPQGPGSDLRGLLAHPVVHVTWHDAAAFCRWAGKRLPSEAEWEKAARGTDGRLYPWGYAAPDSGAVWRANYGLDQCCDASAADGYLHTAPVGSFPAGASPYGLLDVAGNAWEWTQDYYSAEYYDAGPAANPRGPTSGDERSLRGGSWVSPPFRLRASFRGHHTESTRHNYGGFRCACDAR